MNTGKKLTANYSFLINLGGILTKKAILGTNFFRYLSREKKKTFITKAAGKNTSVNTQRIRIFIIPLFFFFIIQTSNI